LTFPSIFLRFWLDFGSQLGPMLATLGPLSFLSWRPLGGLLGCLGGVLGRLGGQEPPEARGMRVLRPQETHLGLIFGKFLDVFFFVFDFSTFFFSYLSRPQHVVKPRNYYNRNTGEPLEALRGQYF